ncbi:DUF1707 domain-containing protein [Nocardia sp. NPDC050710]|uniref:DUF1707 SHOCT-like domain-containing protein n=1 Tax=Nocardia sp. NPDC050710 TaxID=3157220 RepID=UPI0033E570C4
MLHRRRFSGSYPGRTRAREVDRAATVRVLDGARADGQLTADEHEAFTELAAAAKTLGELTELVSDLQRRADAAAATAFASARLVPGRRRGDRGTRGRDGFPRDRSRGPRAAGKCDRSVTLGGEVLDVRPPTE